ncbi:MAG TPA: cytochrome P450 [Acidimicrobiales bacterium]|jgi:cholest-4-en-3-one 26-monooxygenase|nr:cytochrome P450 [Acidimicrobiales bacterium]
MELSDIDLLNRDRFTEGIPHDWFTYLRSNAPIFHHEEPAPGPGFWVFTKHEDVVAIGRDAKHFSSDQRRGGVVGLEDVAEMQDFGEGGQLMLTMDPPSHTRHRRLVNRGFTPKMIAMLEPHIREITVQIIEEAIAKGEIDFVTEVASELPLQVIAELMGVPQEDRHKVFDWSNRMIGSEDEEYRVDDEHVQQAQIEMFMYAQSLADKRRTEPREDIISKLLSADIDGDQLSEMDFNLFFLLLAVAGNETTRNSISHGMNAFLENPDQYTKLVEQPELMDSAIEEILRWASPVMYFRRNVTEDIDYKGNQLKAGDKVSIWYVSANRDEDVFDDPFTFDITRSPNEHIAFGGGGPHHCLGANLARMEMRLFFEELTRRVPSVKSIGEVSRLRSNFIGGIKHLPVRFTAGRAMSNA